jgi:hypothetical protein
MQLGYTVHPLPDMMLLVYNLLTSTLFTFGNARPALPDSLPRSVDSLSIQYIDLRINPLVFSEVKKYISEQRDSSQLFRDGFGYVTIADITSVRNGRPIPAEALGEHLNDVEAEFTIGLISFYPSTAFNMGIPLYYSFVENRLVLIFDQNMKWLHHNKYSSASKQKIKSLVKQTLTQALNPEFQFKGMMSGETFELTPERRELMNEDDILDRASFTLGKLKRVIEYFDGAIGYRYYPH